MGQFFDEIPDNVIEFIQKQHIFWVATAPLAEDGLVNLSSKGLEGTFHVIDAQTVWYEDLSGSGVETIAHLRENGRITVFFNAFEGPPIIVRLFGKGTVYEFGSEEYNSFLTPETRLPGSRAVIKIDVHQVGTSCGWSVPFFQFVSHRNRLLRYTSGRERVDIANTDEKLETPPSGGMKDYWRQKNTRSIDGLPGMLDGHWSSDKFATGSRKYAPDNERVQKSRLTDQNFLTGVLIGVSLAVIVQGSLNRVFSRLLGN